MVPLKNISQDRQITINEITKYLSLMYCTLIALVTTNKNMIHQTRANTLHLVRDRCWFTNM